MFNEIDFITSQAHSSQPELPTTSCSRTLLAAIQSDNKNKFIIQVMHGYRWWLQTNNSSTLAAFIRFYEFVLAVNKFCQILDTLAKQQVTTRTDLGIDDGRPKDPAGLGPTHVWQYFCE